MTETEVRQLVAMSPSIAEPVDFDGWKAMREQYDYTWENIWEFIADGVTVPPEFQMLPKKKRETLYHPELRRWPGHPFPRDPKENLPCRFCQPRSLMSYQFSMENDDENYVFNVYLCPECDAICKEDVADHSGQLWIVPSGDLVATGEIGERIREKGIVIEGKDTPND